MEITICLSGKAGDGSRYALVKLGEMFVKNGYYCFGYYDYQSLIRGGRNFFTLTISDKPINSNPRKIDFLLAMNEEAIEYHGKFSKYIISDESLNGNIKLPFTKIMREKSLKHLNIAMVSFLLGMLKVPYQLWEKELNEENKKTAIVFYEEGKKVNLNLNYKFNFTKTERVFITGNEAKAISSILSGLDLYIAYPMTPATPILHFISKHQRDDLKIFQAENEIAVINAALGASYAGAKVAVGTSGGGFALMNEALSLAGMGEIPLVIFEVQRASPSTGVPTYSLQGDLLYTINAGHGEFLRLVISPGDGEEEIELTNKAFYFAYKYQIPVILLDDKHLGESFVTIEKEKFEIAKDQGRFILSKEEMEKIKDYKRYEITETGISKRAIPGYNLIVRATSYEHDEYGYTVEDEESIVKMTEKRLKKREFLIKEINESNPLFTYGDGEVVIATFGSSKLVALDVIKELEKEGKKLKLVHIKYLEPFPLQAFKKEVEGKKIYTVETNATGLLARLIESYGFEVKRILKYDARPFWREELKEKLIEVI